MDDLAGTDPPSPAPTPADHATLPISSEEQRTLPTDRPDAAPVRLAGAPRMPRRLGPYELLDELGHGGQGFVFRARHEKLGTIVALKVLIAGEHASPEAILRFRREATSIGRMGKHPNIVTIHDLGEEGSLAWYAMEMIEGRSLRQALRERVVPHAEAARWIEKSARALHYAHQRGIVHRDVKPENILLRADGEPQVMDFGLARDVQSEQRISVTGQIMGTIAYMAPEQAGGETEETDAQSDIYALGGVLYEALTGIPPHPSGSLLQVLPAILLGDIIPPRKLRTGIPRDLETVCLKCLRVEKRDRYATAEELAEDLARWQRGEPVHARPASLIERAALVARRRKAAFAAAGALVATLGVVAAVWYFTPGRLVLRVNPAGATIRVGDRTWTAPAPEARLAAGGYQVSVEAPDHEPWKGEVLVERGATKELRVALTHTQGTLEATCEPLGAEIEVDGVAYGSRIRRLAVDTGRHTLTAWSPGHVERSREVVVRRGETSRAEFWLDSGVVWNVDGPQIEFARPTLVQDLNGDGVPEVEAAELSQWVIRSGRDGSAITAFPKAPRLWHGYADLGGAIGQALFLAQEEKAGLSVLCVDLRRPGDDKIAWRWRGPARSWPDAQARPVYVLGDLSDDGVADLAISERDGRLHVISGKGGEEIRELQPGAGLSQVASLGGGELLCILPSGVGLEQEARIVRLADGSASWEGPFDSVAGPWIRDLDGDGALDGLLLDRYGALRAVRWRDRSTIWKGPSGVTSVVSASDRGGLVVRCGDSYVGIDPATGKRTWEVKGIPAEPHLVTDWDGDGKMELVVAPPEGGLLCRDAEGKVRWRIRSERVCSPVFATPDFDGDGLEEFLVVGNAAFLSLVRGPRVLWARRAPKPLQASPIAVDTDGDGALEVISQGPWGKDGTIVCLDGATGEVRWSRAEGSTPNRAPALGDWDGDGRPDVARSLDRGALAQVLRAGDGAVLAALGEGEAGEAYATPVLADLDGDGACDLAMQLWHEKVVGVSHGGHVLWTHATRGKNMGGAAVADLDRDGHLDVVAPSGDGRVYALRGSSGSVLWSAEIGAPGARSPAAIADLDGDGQPEVLVTGGDGTFHVFAGRDGAERWRLTGGTDVWGRASVAREGDRVVLLLPRGEKGVAAIDWRTRRTLWEGPSGRVVMASPVAADLDGDGRMEAVVATWDGELLVFDLDTGDRLWGVRLCDAPIEADPAVADLDGDGVLDIVVADHAGGLTALSGRSRRGR